MRHSFTGAEPQRQSDNITIFIYLTSYCWQKLWQTWCEFYKEQRAEKLTINNLIHHYNHDIMSAVFNGNCSHHTKVAYSSWSCFYPKSIRCPLQKYASWQRFIILILTNLVEYVWISWKVCVHVYILY